MNETAQLLDAVTGLITAVGVIISIGLGAYTLHRQGKTHAIAERVEAQSNGMKTELVAAVRSAATQAGHTQGVKDEKAAEDERQTSSKLISEGGV